MSEIKRGKGRVATKEPKGHKTSITIHVTKWKKMTEDEERSAGRRARTMKKETFETATSFIAPVNEIDTKFKLANFIFQRMGDGTYLIMAFNPKKKCKNYSKKFNCIMQKCFYHPSNYSSKEYFNKYLDRYTITKPCTRYKRHQQGFTCKLNKKTTPNWDKRAEIIINMNREKETFDGTKNDKGYKFLYSKMHYFRWFWREGK